MIYMSYIMVVRAAEYRMPLKAPTIDERKGPVGKHLRGWLIQASNAPFGKPKKEPMHLQQHRKKKGGPDPCHSINAKRMKVRCKPTTALNVHGDPNQTEPSQMYENASLSRTHLESVSTAPIIHPTRKNEEMPPAFVGDWLSDAPRAALLDCSRTRSSPNKKPTNDWCATVCQRVKQQTKQHRAHVQKTDRQNTACPKDKTKETDKTTY